MSIAKQRDFLLKEAKFNKPLNEMEKVTIIDEFGEIEAAENELEGALETGDYTEEEYLEEILHSTNKELTDLDGGYFDIANILLNLQSLDRKKAILNIKKWAKYKLNNN
jgi:hypothetical protein